MMKLSPHYSRLLLIIASSLWVLACSSPVKKPAEKPNILFIAMDDLNDWAGFLEGHAWMKIHTPNLDRLAGRPMIFTNAHTPAPACAPTRAAIMTSVHHARSGTQYVYWGEGPKWREFEALKKTVNLEQFFKNKGV